MALARNIVNKVLNKAISDAEVSKKNQFTKEFTDFLRNQGIKLENSDYSLFGYMTTFILSPFLMENLDQNAR